MFRRNLANHFSFTEEALCYSLFSHLFFLIFILFSGAYAITPFLFRWTTVDRLYAILTNVIFTLTLPTMVTRVWPPDIPCPCSKGFREWRDLPVNHEQMQWLWQTPWSGEYPPPVRSGACTRRNSFRVQS